MSVKVTQGEFERRCNAVHGEKYDYSHDTYKGMHKPYNICCPEHGMFTMRPMDHIHQKNGCRPCYLQRLIEEKKERHVKLVYKAHGDKYKVVDWLDFPTKEDTITGACSLHGEYKTTSYSMLHTGYGGCQECKQIKEALVFISKAVEVHGGKYAYVKEDYTCSRTHMRIYCKEHKEYFYQRPSAHLQGQGCPECGKESQAVKKRKDTEYFITKSKSIYGDKYDYSESVYLSSRAKIKIICPVHGPFYTLASTHWSGNGCTECNSDSRVKFYADKFIRRVSNDPRYNHIDFSEAEYTTNSKRVKCWCKDHEEYFWATPNKLLDSIGVCGCKTCQKLAQNRWTIRALKRVPNIEKQQGRLYIGVVTGLHGKKVGITSDLGQRLTGYRTDLRCVVNHFDYLCDIEKPYLEAAVIETICKKLFKCSKVEHTLSFGGKNEIFNPPSFQVIEDIMAGRYELEIAYISKLATHNNDPVLLAFVEKLRKVYNL